MMDKKIISGYHGTTKAAAKAVCKTQQMFPSKRNNDWLGNGIYFFVNACDAQWWIGHTRYQTEKTAIISATITYIPEHLLDLDIQENVDKLNEVVNTFISLNQECINANIEKHQKWCFACNLIHKLDSTVELIARTFQHPNDSSIFPINRRQLCVFNSNLISEIKELEGALC